MAEKETEFVVKDRRKFNPDGERREGAPDQSEESTEWKETPSVSATPVAAQAAPAAVAAPEATSTPAEEGLPPAPTAAESSEAHAAYRTSAQHLDEMVHAANPGMQPVPEMDFARLVQSIYMTALMQMGAGTPEGQQPRLDILGARQSIDMLGVLGDKTKGNLSTDEANLLQSALFELRMGFLEITQAIARSATQQPPKPAASAQGKPTLVR